MLIKPDIARRQVDEEDPVVPPIVDPPPPGGVPVPPGGTNGGSRLPKRFYASATLDPDRVGRDAGRIADEVLTHLATLPNSRVRVSIEIEVEMPEGAPEHVRRTVSENAQVLKSETQGFEPG